MSSEAPIIADKSPLHSLSISDDLESRENSGLISVNLHSYSRVKPWWVAQSQTKRINEVVSVAVSFHTRQCLEAQFSKTLIIEAKYSPAE
jgi:hypothetical protein